MSSEIDALMLPLVAILRGLQPERMAQSGRRRPVRSSAPERCWAWKTSMRSRRLAGC